MLRRSLLGAVYSGGSLFVSKLICGDCGKPYGKKIWHSTDKYAKFFLWQTESLGKTIDKRIAFVYYFSWFIKRVIRNKKTCFFKTKSTFISLY